MIEMWLGQNFASFDGRVLEIWGPTKSTGRLHVATIGEVVIEPAKGNELYVDFRTVWGPGNVLIRCPTEQRGAAEQIALAIRRAQGR